MPRLKVPRCPSARAQGACRDGRQPPRMQEPLQLPVAERIMCGAYGLVVLTEEVRAFARADPADNVKEPMSG